MKTLMLMGGFAGFVIALITGLLQEVPWPVLLCRACMAALIGGLLLRWWWRVCVRSLHESYNEPLSPDTVPGGPAIPQRSLKP